MGAHHKVIIAGALAAVAALAGCAQPPMVWDRLGTTQTEFSKDQYECVRDTLASGAGADLRAKALDNTQWENTGAVGAIARTITAGNANAEQRAFMQQCMMAHGYTMRDTHAAAQFVAGREAIQPIIAEVSTCTAKVLATPDAAVVLAHGPVDPRELSPAQLADPSLATGQEIAAIGVLRPALRQCQQIALTKLATAVPVAVPPLAEFYAAATANSAQVQARAITWGEYNIRRRDLFLGLQRKLAAVQ